MLNSKHTTKPAQVINFPNRFAGKLDHQNFQSGPVGYEGFMKCKASEALPSDLNQATTDSRDAFKKSIEILCELAAELGIEHDDFMHAVEKRRIELALRASGGSVERACSKLRLKREYLSWVLRHRYPELSRKLRQGEFSTHSGYAHDEIQ
jgi:hypothetical protein